MPETAPVRPRATGFLHLPLRRRVAFYALLAVCQAGLTFAVLEIACRILDPLGVSYYPETAAYMDTMLLEEPIGYRNRPNLRGTFWGASVAINSFGLRDREIALQPEENEIRIVILGDSIPFGVGVEYEESIPYQLERELNAKRSAWRFRTVNMGTPSYNTEQELLQLRTLGLRFQPRVVLLMYMENDIEPKMWIFDKRRVWYVDLIQRSYAACLASRVVKRLAGIGPIGEINLQHYRADSTRWRAVERSLTEISSLCRAEGVHFVVFTFPPNDLVARVGMREGFPVISLWEDPYWRDRSPREYANSATDSHPNAAGSRVYASLISAHLWRLGVLPTEERP